MKTLHGIWEHIVIRCYLSLIRIIFDKFNEIENIALEHAFTVCVSFISGLRKEFFLQYRKNLDVIKLVKIVQISL